ncbi:MAG: hypothetical protein FJY37_12235 [Betaproteobacteria bacterium]|nr:hypothetical protein [Betaproteobacteria bacterium]
MQRDPKAAELLGRLQKDLGTTRLVNEINRNAAPLHAKYSRSHLHYWTQMKRPIPQDVAQWVQNEAFVRLTPWGSFAFLGTKAPWLEMLLDALRRPDADLDAALDVALRLEKAGDILPERPVSADTWPSVAALIGTLYRVKGVMAEARNAFERAVELARKSAPDLLPRYQTNLLNIRREVRYQEFTRKLISPEIYRDFLRTVLAEQKDVLRDARLEGDVTLALRHCLRASSLLDDRKTFTQFLTEARKCKGFGQIPEDRDRALARFMSADHDTDGDFANAREYRCFLELVNGE